MPNSIGFDLNLPMESAQEFWRSKVPLSPAEFAKLSEAAKLRAFAVSGIAKGDELQTVFNAMQRSIDKGTTFADFKKDAAAVFEKRGFSSWRAETVFRTNVQTAYSVGRYKQMMEVRKARPYWRYNAVNDSRTRPTHAAMDNKVFPWDHPFWDKWWPPNGYNCRCGVVTLSGSEVKRDGLKVETKDPTGELVEPVDPLTGSKLPARPLMPDEGFGMNPGKSYWDGLGETLSKRLDKWHPEIGAAVVSDAVKGTAFKLWYKKPKGVFPVARIDDVAAKLIGSQSKTVRLSAETAIKQQAEHPELLAAEYLAVQEAIKRGRRLQDSPMSLIYLLEEATGYVSVVKATQTGKAVFLTSFRRLSRDQGKRDREIQRLMEKREGSKK